MKEIVLILSLLSFSAFADKAVLAGGCFWCVESDLEKIDGVKEVISGYAGGIIKNPTYKQVASGQTRYIESVEVEYDSSKISYQDLLIKFFKTINPTDSGGQFVDRGYQYTSAVFYKSEKEKETALKIKDYLNRNNPFQKEIVTAVKKFTNFYPAEEYHQDFYKKNKKSIARYKSYRKGSGRDQFIKKYWNSYSFDLSQEYKKPQLSYLKKNLSPLQFKVTQKEGTERPFKNEYWDNKKEGIYVDIVSGEPLFSSRDKFKSGTGWPSFTKPINKKYIVEKSDFKLLMKRTEVRSKFGDSHLGHAFPDGPKPTGLRYCINSAALRFISKEDLIKKGYSQYTSLFE